ncbi:MAG: Lpg1974 family pore-forming outer membrane protein [Legionellaceae bacterium]|nr:Lpg1974 family pore-forming outer membrane protein [Legionellaceae bacterium]
MDFNKSLNFFLGGLFCLVQPHAFAGTVGTAPVNKADIYASLLYFQPNSNNLNYAVFVSGLQPLYQSWHYQSINPDYSPGFEVGGNYTFSNALYQASVDWVHLNTRDSSFKQASQSTTLATVEFVAPPFEQSPPVFGIKRADSTAAFNFDSIELNVGRMFEHQHHSQLRAKLYGGLNVLRIKQTLTTVFSDMQGSPATPYSYALSPDPSFSFQLKNTSDYVGVGPDLGINIAYTVTHGLGVLGDFVGTLTAGNVRVKDQFTSTSARLTALGVGVSQQEITVPDATRVVPGFDGKLGVFYNYFGKNIPKLTFEVGYRFAAYINAISTVNPSTLVQAGTVILTPEFATGTMAIVSSDVRDRPFNFNGPYLKLNVAIA